MNGIIVINKPLGKTSHDMVYFTRRLTGIKKVGHTGTLDPSATGVLPVCIGNATKVCDLLTNADKAYRTSFVLGMTTDTLDADGEVLSDQPVLADEGEIRTVISGFVGEITQTPPMYSAVKVNGQKLYELARKGIEVERKTRKVTIQKIDIISVDMQNFTVTMDVYCSKGTYIRTLCDDIGMKLGCGAFVSRLMRIKSGVFSIDESYTPEELTKLKEEGRLFEALMKTDSLFSEYPKIVLGKNESERVKNGARIKYDGLEDGKLYRLYDEKEFLSVSRADGGKLVLEKPFWER